MWAFILFSADCAYRWIGQSSLFPPNDIDGLRLCQFFKEILFECSNVVYPFNPSFWIDHCGLH